MRHFIVLTCVLLSSSCAVRESSEVAELDVVLLGGRVVDGTGAAWFYGDVGIKGDRIARITRAGLLADAPTAERIDASGLVVAPGFIDIQSHSRRAFLTGDGRVVSKTTQGITTETLGEGWTNAPANEKTLARARAEESFEDEHGFDTWLRAMEEHGISSNVGSFVGATTIRVLAKGEEMGPATEAELELMRDAARRAMEDGAFGFASALIYPPGNFASIEELAEIAKAVAPYGGIYITHMRSEADQYLEAIEEAIQIGRDGGVPVEIYHLKASGQRNWHKAQEAIDLIDRARTAGMDIQANMYPYVAGGTGLAAVLPPWASAEGKLLDNLRDPQTRKRIHDEVLSPETEWENLGQLATPEGILIVDAGGEANKAFVGRRLSEIARDNGVDWVDAAIDLLLAAESRVGMVVFAMAEDNVKLQMRQPWIKFGTDAGGADPQATESMVHPRTYGTYPRILGKYVREEGVLTLEDAVRKMSSAVATRLSIPDRGLLKEGLFADVVVFDPDSVIDKATFEEPHQVAVGVEYVFVNGVAVVRESKHTGEKPGRVVRGPGWSKATF